MTTSTRIVRDLGNFRAIGRDWNDLLACTSTKAVWLTHQWLDCWWRSFGGEAQMFVPAVWQRDRLIAAAPMMIVEDVVMRSRCRVLRFMENGITPRSQFLSSPDVADSSWMLWDLIGSCRKEWDLAILANVPHEEACLSDFRTSLLAAGMPFLEAPDRQSPFVDLSEGFQAFRLSVSSNLRHNINKAHNRLSKLGTVEVRSFPGTRDLAEALEICFEVSSRSWKAKESSDLGRRPAHRAFYRDLASNESMRNRLHVWILEIDHTQAAFIIMIRSGGTMTGLATDYDLAFEHCSPGLYLFSRMIEDLTTLGISRCDMAGEMYTYKRFWTKQYLPHSRFWVFHRGVKSRFLHLMKARVSPALRRSKTTFPAA